MNLNRAFKKIAIGFVIALIFVYHMVLISMAVTYLERIEQGVKELQFQMYDPFKEE